MALIEPKKIEQIISIERANNLINVIKSSNKYREPLNHEGKKFRVDLGIKDQLIPNFEPISDYIAEINLAKWFKKYYQLFGFTDIKKSNIKNTDYLCRYANKQFCIELEDLSGNFLLHKHDPNIVGMVICNTKDIDLNIPTIPVLTLCEEVRNGQ